MNQQQQESEQQANNGNGSENHDLLIFKSYKKKIYIN